MMKHKNIPIFIPHLGCKNACVFCSQTKITGVEHAEAELDKELERVKSIIENALPTVEGNAEIAFFGGSFTGIGECRMEALLQCANKYANGRISGIRCSTRPDYVNPHICEILKKYNVTSVELGIQSTNDRVLEASRRGHDSKTSEYACRLLKEHGFELGGQMMVGMPESSLEDEVRTAEDIVSFGADTCRIYPMVVFDGTPLYDMVLSGEYIPLSNEEAAHRAAECAKIFIDSGVEILRIGLHSSESLAEAPYGAKHPAMGELVEGEIYLSKLKEQIKSDPSEKKSICFAVPKGEISKCTGHKGVNKYALYAEFGKIVRFTEDDSLKKYNVRIIV